MHGCTLRFMPIVNAEIDSMGGVIDPGVGISSKPSLQQSSDLENTQAELRQTFTAAEKFRRELEFLQKGGDPLDLKPLNPASISFQSTSLTDRHLTSEAKGSFAITASPHGDSVESSGRLGGGAPPSLCEPNSADNLDIIRHVSKESGDSAVLELPKKSYKRRIRSRPNRDGARSSSNDAVPHFLPFRQASNSKPKSPNELLDGVTVTAGQSTLGPPHGPHSENLAGPQNNQDNHHEEQVDLSHLKDSKCPVTETEKSENLVGPTNGFGNIEEVFQVPTKVLDSESSCGQSQSQSQSQTGQRCEGNNNDNNSNNNGLGLKEVVLDVEGNDIVAEEKDDKLLNIEKDKNGDGCVIKEEEEEGLNELKNSVCTTSEPETKPQGLNDNADVAEKNECSQGNLTLATKEHEDSILEEARIIEAKRKRIAELSVRSLPLEKRLKSQWDFVLEEMSWLANDFAQERLWKVTASAQISKKAAHSSLKRFQKQTSLHKQKEVAHTLTDAVMQFWHMIQVKKEESESQVTNKEDASGVEGYGLRFLEYNNCKAESQYKSTEAALTCDPGGIVDLSWEDNLTEENLFYTVPPGAIEAYRNAIESHLLQFERSGTIMQEEVDTSGYDAVTETTYEEDEGNGETNTYYLPGSYESGHKSITIKTNLKRRKNLKFERGIRSPYDMAGGGDVAYGGGAHTTQPSVLSGKRPLTSLNVSIPTKRMRTASRQRVISPFHAGTSGCVQTPHRTDGSSGDTNSFQDEQSSLLHGGGSHVPNSGNNNMEAESVGEYEKQLHFDSMELSNRPKKKKKIKHPGSTFDHRWQLDSNFQNDQDHSRRRLDTHQFDSNGSSVASQMSNMSNPNKIMKLLVRDRGRKAKGHKTPIGPPGSGSPWSLFEDQALVVLVHDMGPNWELISDAINSTLQFKCIFRKSKECKERHKILMDRNTGDGADSAEDSGSSQPYPSTLPGIPEGSARQLFQRLQGPMEEDTLKSHFEKIIMIGHKQHYRRAHNDNQDPKQLQQPHSSHAFALSQVVPNNLNGGPVLTPLELSEPVSSTPDVGYQGAGLNHGSVPPSMASTSGHGTNLSSVSGPVNPPVRDGRYGIPRTGGSLSVDDQQKMQHYNQMLSARNTNQSGLPPGSHSVGVRMLPAGSGMGVMCGMTRGIKMARPPSIINPSTSSTPNPPNQSQGNSMLRSREPVHMVRANHNTDVPISNPNPHHPNNFPQHPAFAMRYAKERQLQQQRLRQQHQQFPTSNPIPPHVQPPQDPQLPSSVPGPQKHPVPTPHGIIMRPNQITKQQRPRHPQFQQPAKVVKGGLSQKHIVGPQKVVINRKPTPSSTQTMPPVVVGNDAGNSSETPGLEKEGGEEESGQVAGVHRQASLDSVQWQQQQKPPS